jgi:hypothetical protein
MRRVIAAAGASLFVGASLAGCSSFSLDSFRPAPDQVQVQLDSSPQGADARTSLGPGCKTPCSVSVPAPDSGFSVTFAMDRFEPQTVQVQVIRNTGAFNTAPPIVLDPNPVVVELQPGGPPPKSARRARPRKPRLPKSAAAPAESVFPSSNLPPR